MRALALLVLIAAATPGAAQVLPRRFAAAEIPADQPSPGSFVEAAAAPSLYYGLFGGLMGALGAGKPGAVVGFVVPYALVQGASTTWLAPARR